MEWEANAEIKANRGGEVKKVERKAYGQKNLKKESENGK